MDKKEKLLADFSKEKWIKFFICLSLDLVGSASILFPGIGALTDLPFAALSASALAILFWKYGKARGLGAGVLNFAEEFLPFLDFIPSGLITWISVYVKDEKKSLQAYIEQHNERQELLSKVAA